MVDAVAAELDGVPDDGAGRLPLGIVYSGGFTGG